MFNKFLVQSQAVWWNSFIPQCLFRWRVPISFVAPDTAYKIPAEPYCRLGARSKQTFFHQLILSRPLKHMSSACEPIWCLMSEVSCSLCGCRVSTWNSKRSRQVPWRKGQEFVGRLRHVTLTTDVIFAKPNNLSQEVQFYSNVVNHPEDSPRVYMKISQTVCVCTCIAF